MMDDKLINQPNNYNRTQKNLGLCEKALPCNFYVGLCSYRQFFNQLWVHPINVRSWLMFLLCPRRSHQLSCYLHNSLCSKRFRLSYCAKVGARAKENGRKGRERGKRKPSPFPFISLTTQTTPIKPLFYLSLGGAALFFQAFI